ncbi:SURF1 family protein [Microbacteriaceae bacterium VKM Ac-2855]|nr:SURF1 family protein [Microbacteriaceae bacterium VKM Ac-2855]
MSESVPGKWRFAFSRRWFGYLGLTIVFAITCVLLSNWQVARLNQASSENKLVDENWDAAPVGLDELLPALDSWDPTLKYRSVSVTGVYESDEQILVRNRPNNGNPGFEILTPLRLSDGSLFIVDRGWLPVGDAQDSPDLIPEPPSGEVTVTARLKQGEGRIDGRSAPAGQVATIQLDDVADILQQPTYTGGFGLLTAEDPAPAQARPVAAEKPVADEGLHISYAIQWVLFALMGFFGLAWAIRHEYRIRNADDPEVQQAAERREARRLSRPLSDADAEDALLDRH